MLIESTNLFTAARLLCRLRMQLLSSTVRRADDNCWCTANDDSPSPAVFSHALKVYIYFDRIRPIFGALPNLHIKITGSYQLWGPHSFLRSTDGFTPVPKLTTTSTDIKNGDISPRFIFIYIYLYSWGCGEINTRIIFLFARNDIRQVTRWCCMAYFSRRVILEDLEWRAWSLTNSQPLPTRASLTVRCPSVCTLF
jgi:hypothetical protein